MDFLKNIFSYLRAKDWLIYIIPPILSFFYIGLLENNLETVSINQVLYKFWLLFLLSICVASFGFFINEWTDIKDDALALKQNQLAQLSITFKCGILSVLVISIACLLYLFLKIQPLIFVLCSIQLLLFIFYSVKPFRLKRNKFAALILDALYSGTLFYVIAYMLGTSQALRWNVLVPMVCWSFTKGIRNILYHLIQDKKYDAVLDFKTVATSIHTSNLKQAILKIILPFEVICYVLFLMQLNFGIIFLVSFVLYLLYIFNREKYIIPFLWKRKTKIDRNQLTEINLFYERYLSIIVLSVLMYRDMKYIVLGLFSILLFGFIFQVNSLNSKA